ncbi:MAG: hypothetical protein A3A33_04065 [Candidatus Yanofskybacteria bacterium RIFCSPLOWO2_01_FULL_49_25]|uniref:Alpha/beta hydrolase n=1 Tax=Candidatus Yanofskybacteria bacterium RIFCSPLOWO2_01_FULL_49_25 TaxID=1802701 RepID=A0A1F8GRP7_9BACT|nr:MAG: hypothetical protein A3A33_04065 [Candidatus Yanofskybacteria bacterium RIFCSPLOWO2_01_FULL_49_25]
MKNINVIFIPGNGGGSTKENWFPYVQSELEKLGLTVIAEQFPDPDLARAEYWLPFLEKLGTDEHTILIGHSSGALAAMRYAEHHNILGSVLVGVAHTDGGDVKEKASGYFDTPWDWVAIKRNQQWIIEFHSTDDPYIAVAEARFVHDKLDADYHEFTDRGHFFPADAFPELIESVTKKLKQ